MESNSEPDWITAKKGLILFLNNKVDEAEFLFSQKSESFHIKVARCYLAFMNALMTFDDQNIQQATKVLKEMELECGVNEGWIKSLSKKLFKSKVDNENYIRQLEQQIVLADIQVCTAILIFLQQDVNNYVQTGWIIHKAWRIYRQTYHQILHLYRQTFGINPSGFNDSKQNDNGIRRSDYINSNWYISLYNTSLLTIPSSILKPSLRNSVSAMFSINNVTSNCETNSINPAEIIRLMSAVSFGYGIFQLSMSLIPHSFLKIVHFLGFEGDRRVGLTALMYARLSEDMRAPLATLSLLCYHTIIRPLYFTSDKNVNTGIKAAKQLINECHAENNRGSLWLFFTGRIERLQSNFHSALKAYNEAMTTSPQKEIRLLCLHEVAWCHAIKLNYTEAFNTFTELKNESRGYMTVYAYLSAVCIGASGQLMDFLKIYNGIINMLSNIEDTTPLHKFILRRVSKTAQHNGSAGYSSSYYKILVFEFLYLWNAMPTCTPDCLLNIISECKMSEVDEPMVGLCFFLIGAANNYLGDTLTAITYFRECLNKRNSLKTVEDPHVSSFALYELGVCLCKIKKVNEGRAFLMKARTGFTNYDFESRLIVRIQSALKLYT